MKNSHLGHSSARLAREFALAMIFALDTAQPSDPTTVINLLLEDREMFCTAVIKSEAGEVCTLPSDQLPEDPSAENYNLAVQKLALKQHPESEWPEPGTSTPEIEEALLSAQKLSLDVWLHRQHLDELLKAHVVGWRPNRMSVVDRTILRLALYEGFVAQIVPPAVAISEAVELAKIYGGEESGRFVNGALAKIYREMISCQDHC